MQATASGLTASIDAARPTLELPRRGKLYVIETQWWHQVGLVRTLTANHLLTLTPQSGDKIVADLDWHVGAYEDGTIEVAVNRSSYETQLGILYQRCPSDQLAELASVRCEGGA